MGIPEGGVGGGFGGILREVIPRQGGGFRVGGLRGGGALGEGGGCLRWRVTSGVRERWRARFVILGRISGVDFKELNKPWGAGGTGEEEGGGVGADAELAGEEGGAFLGGEGAACGGFGGR